MVISCKQNIHCNDSACPSHVCGWIQDEVNQIHLKGGKSDDIFTSKLF